ASDQLLWDRIPSPAPILPAEPACFSRSWLLPRGIIPLNASRLQLVPSAERASGSWLENLAVARSSPLPPPLWARSLVEWKSEQQRLLADASMQLALRFGNAQDYTLRDVLHFLIFDVFKERQPLLVDVLALEAQGITPFTALGAK